MSEYINVTQGDHVTVILLHGDQKEVHRFETNIPLRKALVQFAKEKDLEGEIKSTKFGTMLIASDGNVYRATFRRRK